MRFEFNHTYSYQNWRKNYPQQPDELFVMNSFVNILPSNKWFGRLYRYRYDGNTVEHITLFKFTIVWGKESYLMDDEYDEWLIHKAKYDKNRKSKRSILKNIH